MTANPGYDFQIFTVDTISSPFLYINSRPFYNVTSAGYQQTALKIDRRAYGLQGAVLGAGPNDSLVFSTQVDTLSSPLNIIKFPATANSVWASNYKTKVNFVLNAPAFGFNNAPGFNLRYENQTDSVIGFGTVFLRNIDGSQVGPIQVLEVKVAHNRTDSFYLNGTPAPPALLQPPFLQQGSKRNTYSYKFFREMDLTPIVEIFFTDSTYTTVRETRADIVRFPTNVSTLSNTTGIYVYPNPVTDHMINVALTATINDNWTYRVVNAAGQLVTEGGFAKGQTKQQVKLPAVAPGVYYLQLNNNGVKTLVKAVNIVE